MSHCQQINSKPNQYIDYNQTINKIYFNPYSIHVYSEQTSSNKNSNMMLRKSHVPMSSTELREIDNENNKLLLNMGSFKSEGEIKNYHEGNIKNAYQSSRNGRLSVSQIFNENQMKWKEQKKLIKNEQKPTINYFVTQFQRLQQQNKILKMKIQQLEKKSSLCPLQSEVNPTQMDLLYQNQKLKKQLEQQRGRNRQKKTKINELMDKINQIQEHMELVVLNSSIKQSTLEQQRKIEEQKKVLEQKKQFENQIHIAKNKFNQNLENTVNNLLQKIKILQATLSQSILKYQDLQTQVTNLNNTLNNI